jgi:hypothetical protein
MQDGRSKGTWNYYAAAEAESVEPSLASKKSGGEMLKKTSHTKQRFGERPLVNCYSLSRLNGAGCRCAYVQKYTTSVV